MADAMLTRRERFAEVEFLQLAIPRRMYSNEQIEYVAQALTNLYRRRSSIARELSVVEEKPIPIHFTVRLSRKELRSAETETETEVNQ